MRVDVGVGLDAQARDDETLNRETVEFELPGVAVDHVRVIAGRGHVGEDEHHGLAPVEVVEQGRQVVAEYVAVGAGRQPSQAWQPR